MSGFDLPAYLSAERPRVEGALRRAVRGMEGLLPDPLVPATAHGVLSGGKRLRPILCVTAYRACGGTGEGDALYDLAASLELIHAYSLMHDDLPCMDDAGLRRGRPTTHVEHGEVVTMVAGVALIPVAALLAYDSARALGCDEARARHVAGRLMEASGPGGLVGGQWLDLLGEGGSLDPDELDGLHRRKTGALLSASLAMGAAAAGARPKVEDAVEVFGGSVGLAFQIADDILDATSSAETLGKHPSDAALAKSTYVALYGLEEARALARAQVDHALDALDDVGLEAPALRALAGYVVDRRH